MVLPEPMLARSGPLPLEPGLGVRAEARRLPRDRPRRRPAPGPQPARLEHDPAPAGARRATGGCGARWRARRARRRRLARLPAALPADAPRRPADLGRVRRLRPARARRPTGNATAAQRARHPQVVARAQFQDDVRRETGCGVEDHSSMGRSSRTPKDAPGFFEATSIASSTSAHSRMLRPAI